MDALDATRLKELERENARLKKLLAERDLEIEGVPFGQILLANGDSTPFQHALGAKRANADRRVCARGTSLNH